ncbi:MAG: Lrp/AsnC family transcriptional regulator [Hyphomicrobiaceae bacterium]
MATDKDKQLIALLKLDARESTASLARKLGLSRTTVQDRLKKLERDGTIEGYTLRLRSDTEAKGVKAFVIVEVEPRRIAEVITRLKKIPEIETLYSVSGKFDLIAMLRAESAEDLDEVLDRIGETTGVEETESAIILSTKVDRR